MAQLFMDRFPNKKKKKRNKHSIVATHVVDPLISRLQMKYNFMSFKF